MYEMMFHYNEIGFYKKKKFCKVERTLMNMRILLKIGARIKRRYTKALKMIVLMVHIGLDPISIGNGAEK